MHGVAQGREMSARLHAAETVRKWWKERHNAFVLNFFLPYLALFLIPIMVMSIFIFVYVRNVLEEQLILADMRALSSARSSIDQMILDMGNIYSSIDDFNYIELGGEINEGFAYYDASKKLKMFLESNGRISELFYFLAEENVIITTSGVFDGAYNIQNFAHTPITVDRFRQDALTAQERSVVNYGDVLMFYYPSGQYLYFPERVVAFQLSSSEILGMIEYTDADFYVFTADLEPLIIPRGGADDALMRAIDCVAGSGVINSRKDDMLASYQVSGINGWIYINAHTRSEMLKKLLMLEAVGIVILLGVTLTGFFTIARVTKKTYHPIREMRRNIESHLSGEVIGSLATLANRLDDVYLSNRQLRESADDYARILGGELLRGVLRGQVGDMGEFWKIAKSVTTVHTESFRLLVMRISPAVSAEEVFDLPLGGLYDTALLARQEERADASEHMLLVEGEEDPKATAEAIVSLMRREGYDAAGAATCELFDLYEVRQGYYSLIAALENAQSGVFTVVPLSPESGGTEFRQASALVQRFESDLHAERMAEAESHLNIFMQTCAETRISEAFLRCLCYDLAMAAVRRIRTLSTAQMHGLFRQCEDCDVRGLTESIGEALRGLPARMREEAPEDALIRSIDKYVRTRMSDPNLNVQQVASELGYSYKYISRFYKEKTGERLSELINRLRIAFFKERLLKSDEPIVNLIQEAGFESVATLNRLFKQQEGITPGRYRELMRSAESNGSK